MKLHRHIVQSITDILSDIFVKEYYADKALEYHFKKNKKWGARDRKLVAESVYDIVRWWRRLWYALDHEPTCTSRELWRLFGAWLIVKKQEVPEWVEWETLNSNLILDRYNRAQAPPIRLSLPDWLYELGTLELGDDWSLALAEMNEVASVVLRTNTLKTSVRDLIAGLEREGVFTHPLEHFSEALVLKERTNVFKTESFKQGLFEVQDASSQLVAKLLDPQPGERVIDACAGAGGKTLHISALMANKGKVLALDVEDHKLEQLRKRVARAGVDIVESRCIESTKSIKRLRGTADRLLLDVPCSGTGVWKRNPDSKWKLTPEVLEGLRQTQDKILNSYFEILKPGGVLVYSTCSIFPSENQGHIQKFSDQKGWEIEKEITRLPHRDGFDGFYMAKLRRPLS